MTENEKLETKAEAAVEPEPEAVVESEAEPKGAKPKKVKKPRGKFSKLLFNPRGWISYDEVKANTNTTVSLFRRLLSRGEEKPRQETYEEAIARLGINDAQVISREKNFLYSALVYLAFALGFFIYFFYLLFNLKFLAAALTIILIILMSLATYREHFWYMQMHKKKLGCSFNDWLTFVLRRNG